MVIHTYSKIYKKELFLISISILLFLWATTSTIFAFSKKNEVLLIGENKDGMYVVGLTNESHNQVINNFIRRFLILYYSYDSRSFVKNMTLATDLINEEYFISLKEKINEKEVESKQTNQFAEVISITKNDENSYDAHISIKTIKESNSFVDDYKIRLSIKPSVMTKMNPWGYEVIQIEEKRN